ncbi:hypothetical protein ACLBWZ_06570 [Brucellaceae bacterium C25G]
MSDQTKSSGKKGRKALLWTTAAIIVVIGGGLTSYKYYIQNNISKLIAKNGGTAETLSADFLGNIHLANVTIPLENGQNIKVETFDGRPQILFISGGAKATGISTEAGTFKMNIPQIEIDDANFSQQVLAELFSDSSELSLAQKVERFAAKRIHVTEIQLEQSVINLKKISTYKNLTLNNIQDGKIESIQINNTQSAINLDLQQPDASTHTLPLSTTTGLTEIENIDAAFLVRFFTEKADPDNNDPKQVYSAFRTKNIVSKLGPSASSIDLVKSTGISMRLPQYPLWDLMQEAGKIKNINYITDPEGRIFFRKFISIYKTFSKGEFEIIGMNSTNDNETQTTASVSMNFENLVFSMAFKDLNYQSSIGHYKINDFSWAGVDFASTIESAEIYLELPIEQTDNFPYNTLMPTFGTLTVTGVDYDMSAPNADKVPAKNEENSDDVTKDEPADPTSQLQLQFKLSDFKIALLKPVNGIPTNIQITFNGLEFPIPAASEQTVHLRELGFNHLLLSSNTNIVWDEPSESLMVNDFSIEGDKLGTIAFSGVINNMSRDIFSGDKATMQIAALGLRPREINSRIIDKGLVKTAIEYASLENETSEEVTRQLIIMTIAAMSAQLADQSSQVMKAVEALKKFVANPNIFTLSIKSKNEKGISAFEMIAASQNPLSLLDKVDIIATTE